MPRTPDFLQALASTISLTRLPFKTKDVADLVAKLGDNHVSTFKLWGKINDENLEKLVNALATNRSLTNVDMFWTQLGPRACATHRTCLGPPP